MDVKYYVVSFKYSEMVYCTNLAIADSEDKVREHYSGKYEWVSIRVAKEWEIDSYKKRGMPVINCMEKEV